MTWADVLLMPGDPSYTDQAITLTVDAVPDCASEFIFDKETIALAVRAADFSKEECLAWVERWLKASFTCSGIAAGTLDEFAGRSNMADVIIRLRDRAE